MQISAIGLIGHCAQDGALVVVGLVEQCERLVAVAGQDHMIEVFAAVIGDDRHPTVPGGVVVALDAPDRRGAANVGKPGQDALDILARATAHRPSAGEQFG